VAKALRDFSRANPHLVIKGGLADGALLSTSDLAALADLPPRDVLLARLAGALAAPMQQMAGLLQALPRNLAYGMQALIDQKGGVDETPAEEAPAEAAGETGAEAEAADTPEEAPAEAAGETGAEAEAADTPEDAPAAEAPAEEAAAAEAETEPAAADAADAADAAPEAAE
jgi:large subunit ribosomal protein L10